MENQSCPRLYRCIDANTDFFNSPSYIGCSILNPRPEVLTSAGVQRTRPMRTCCSDSLEFELLEMFPIGEQK